MTIKWHPPVTHSYMAIPSSPNEWFFTPSVGGRYQMFKGIHYDLKAHTQYKILKDDDGVFRVLLHGAVVSPVEKP